MQERVLGATCAARAARRATVGPARPAEVARDGFVRDLGGAYEYWVPTCRSSVARVPRHALLPPRAPTRMFARRHRPRVRTGPPHGPDVEAPSARRGVVGAAGWSGRSSTVDDLPPRRRRRPPRVARRERRVVREPVGDRARRAVRRARRHVRAPQDGRGGAVGAARGGRPPAALARRLDARSARGRRATVFVPASRLCAPTRSPLRGVVPDLPDDSLDVVVAVEHPRFAVLGLASAARGAAARGARRRPRVRDAGVPTLLAALARSTARRSSGGRMRDARHARRPRHD